MPLIARGITVAHIYNDELIEGQELQRSIDQCNDYEFTVWRKAVAVA